MEPTRGERFIMYRAAPTKPPTVRVGRKLSCTEAVQQAVTAQTGQRDTAGHVHQDGED